MLMFDNGLLATFIPEILMVLGYLFCLIVPGFKTDTTASTVAPKVIEVTAADHAASAVYTVSTRDFQNFEVIEADQTPTVCYFSQTHSSSSNLLFRTTDGLCYVQFSRPPPSFLS